MTPQSFELSEAHPSDLPALVEVLTLAFSKDAEWELICRNVKPDGIHQYWLDTFTRNLQNKAFVYFVIKEVSTGKIVAWSGLSRPHKMSEEEVALASKEILLPDGLPKEPFNAYLESVDTAKNYGFDPEAHFRTPPRPSSLGHADNSPDRRITMVHPDYQGLGLGSTLSKHCNDLADKAGARTYVFARKSSKPMLLSLGFKVLGTEGQDLSKYGGKKDDALLWMMMREPVSSRS